jgi:Primase C terminal 2 (PriCT-2)
MSVAPPSKTKKGTYTWLNKRRIARAPQWLLDLVTKPARAPGAAVTNEPTDIAKLTLAIAMVPNNDRPWDSDPQTIGWNDIGMALYAATGGSKKGLDLFHAFSKRSTKYNEAATDAKWKALHGCPPHEIGAGTIFYLAEQSMPDYMSRIIEHDPEVIALLEEFHKLLGEP